MTERSRTFHLTFHRLSLQHKLPLRSSWTVGCDSAPVRSRLASQRHLICVWVLSTDSASGTCHPHFISVDATLSVRSFSATAWGLPAGGRPLPLAIAARAPLALASMSETAKATQQYAGRHTMSGSSGPTSKGRPQRASPDTPPLSLRAHIFLRGAAGTSSDTR